MPLPTVDCAWNNNNNYAVKLAMGVDAARHNEAPAGSLSWQSFPGGHALHLKSFEQDSPENQ